MKLVLLIFFISIALFGQNANTKLILEGKVISKINNEPVQGCNVFIKNTQMGTMADSLGNFIFYNLNKNGQYIISVSASGYPMKDTSIYLAEGTPKTITIFLNTDCIYDSTKAVEDLKNGKAKLLIAGGIAPMANSKEDLEFEAKYKVQYYDFGCTPPAYECISQYNKIIFEYLNNKYQNEWLRFVRKDVIGLK
ncbi:MAG: carboxypeptidase-like regulatory domain-containing protein [Ignavibacteria bacterium]|nr:carboxypeptidase-like regulatory domain-containing protein [Ignavibacteria bacterium]